LSQIGIDDHTLVAKDEDPLLTTSTGISADEDFLTGIDVPVADDF
jgi:hypothetical protein